MLSKSIKGNSTDEIQKAFRECIADGFQPTLAFVFMSIHQDRMLFLFSWMHPASAFLAQLHQVNLSMK
jgi:hypothetical protein